MTVVELSAAALLATFIAANPVGRMSAQFAPATPLARLKPSSTGVVGASGEAAVTTAVGLEAALVVPAVLVAVTVASMVDPMSALVTVYALVVAPGMAVQLLPLVSQSCH